MSAEAGAPLALRRTIEAGGRPLARLAAGVVETSDLIVLGASLVLVRATVLGPFAPPFIEMGFALLALGVGWRRLVRDEQAPDPIADAAQRVREALDGGRAEDALSAGLSLHEALSLHRVASEYVGPRSELERRREEIRFGGETADVEAVREAVAPLLAIAGALE